jgi:Ca2+-binding RTX toxin-like protein
MGKRVVTGTDGPDLIDKGRTFDAFDISGLGGDDRIIGAFSSDRIDGGPGDDHLAGSLGADTFVFHKGEIGASESVDDFERYGRFSVDSLRFEGFGPDATLSAGVKAGKHAFVFTITDPGDPSNPNDDYSASITLHLSAFARLPKGNLLAEGHDYIFG